jgi:hypothetical protein
LPSAFRPAEEKKDGLLKRYLISIQHQYRHIYTDWIKWVEAPQGFSNDQVGQTARKVLAHAALIRDFVLLAHSAKHRVFVPEVLWHLYNPKKPELHTLFNGITEIIDPIFAIAQHHGVPTGLLDWTYNPLIAAYFAAENPHPHSSDIAVWALRENIVEPDMYLRRLTVPSQVIPFLDAQEGLFTWFPKAYLIHLELNRFPTVEEMVHLTAREVPLSAKAGPLLLKLTLPIREAVKLLQLLWREKVSPAHLMPTFDNVTQGLRMQSKLLPNLYE